MASSEAFNALIGQMKRADFEIVLAETNRLNDEIMRMGASRNGYASEAAKAYEALAKIIRTYDAYRGRGLAPAPVQYQAVVGAIDEARSIMAPQFQTEQTE